MNCYAHAGRAAVGVCALCGKGICRDCVARDTPRLLCATCIGRGGLATAWPAGRYGASWEYRSAIAFNGWPLLHVCFGNDPVTYRPRVARGVIAIGNIAIGAVAIGGASIGLITVGGLSIGLAAAIGGAAIGTGLSIGGFAFGSIAVGGAAVGLVYAIGGGAVGPAVLSAARCDQAALDFVRQWLSQLPHACR